MAAVALIIAASPRCFSSSGPTLSPSPNTTSKDRSSRGLSRPSSAPGSRCGEVVVEPDVGLLQLGQPVGDGGVDAEVAHRRRPSATRSRPREMKESSRLRTTPRVVCSDSRASSCAVASISANRSSWSRATLSSSAWVGCDLRGEPQGVRLVQLEDGHVGAQATAQRDLAEHRGDDAAGEVAAGGVGEDAQAVLAQDRDQHLGGRGLAVGAGHHHDAARQPGQRVREEPRVHPLDDQPRQRRPATPEP